MFESGSFPGTERYAPVRLLGVGGMGAVYEVTDQASGQRLALKVMLEQSPRRLLRFKQEFRVIAELNHPNLIRFFDLVHKADGRWFFTMELIEGQELLEALLNEEEDENTISLGDSDSLMRGFENADHRTALLDTAPGPLKAAACDLEACRALLGQVLDALEYLHAQNIVHRDLKPSNILVDISGVVRLLDFGLVGKIDRSVATSPDGAVIGTIAYMSPEQCAGRSATPASDLYALGSIMFHLLTGQLPFEGTAIQMMRARLNRPPPRVERRVVGVPQEMVEVCRALMATNPDDRPSIDAVRTALRLKRGGQHAPLTRQDTHNQQVFVGRHEEMSTLERCLERALEGEQQLVLLSGLSGMGKSTLASKLHTLARNQDCLCFRGRCYEREQVPFVAFDRAVDEMILTLASWPGARLKEMRSVFWDICTIFPAMEALCTKRSEPSPQQDPRTLFQKAFDGFCRLVEHCQDQTPLLFILDDLQWADHESIALLKALVAQNSGRVFVLGLYRSDISDDHPLHELIADHAADKGTTLLKLKALDTHNITRLVTIASGEPLDARFGEVLSEQLKGNPFMALQFARQLAQMEPEARTSYLETTINIDGLLHKQIEDLAPSAEIVLSIAATAGGDIGLNLLRQASGLAFDAFDTAFKALISSRMLKTTKTPEQTPTQEMRVDLYHDRIRAAAYNRLDPERRKELHRTLALALEERASDQDHVVEALLRHWGDAGDKQRRRQFAREAAEQAEAQLAFQRAVRLFHIVLEEPSGIPASEQAKLYERIGLLCEYSGNFLEASVAYQQALDFWIQTPQNNNNRQERLLRLRGRVCENLVVTGNLKQGRTMLTQGLRSLGLQFESTSLKRFLTLVWLRILLVLVAVLPERLIRRKTTPLLREKIIFFDLVSRAVAPIWPITAMEAAMRCELLGWQLDDKQVLQRSMAFKAALLIFVGQPSQRQLQKARADLDRAEALAHKHTIPLGLELVQFNRSMLWLAVDLDRAKTAHESTLESFARLGMSKSHEGALARGSYLMTLASKGDGDELLRACEHELSLKQQHYIMVALSLLVRALHCIYDGTSQEAEEAVEAIEIHVADQPKNMLSTFALTARVALLTMQGRFEEGLAYYHKLQSFKTLQVFGYGIPPSYRVLWLTSFTEASIGLARHGKLSASRHRRALKWSRWVQRNGPIHTRSQAYRNEALLHHSRGKHRAAHKALNKALNASLHNTPSRVRWLCLEAARDIGTINTEMNAEAATLKKQGYTFPVGWYPTSVTD